MDPPAVMAQKRSTALPPIDISQTATKKREHGRPPLNRAIQPAAPIPDLNEVVADDLNKTLPTLYPVMPKSVYDIAFQTP